MKSIWLVSFMLFRFRLYRLGAENTANHRLTRRHEGVTFCLRDILSPMCPGRTSVIVVEPRGIEPLTSAVRLQRSPI